MHENQFTVNVKDLDHGPFTLKVDCDPADLQLTDDEYDFPSPVTGEVVFSQVRPRVVAEGTLKTTIQSQCVRCLNDALMPLDIPVNAIYENKKEMQEGRSEVVTAEEQIVTPYNGEWIQPEDELREAILLELPALPLCRPDCKGLCPKCGADLNEGQCSCQIDATDETQEVSPWKAAIKGVKLDGEKK